MCDEFDTSCVAAVNDTKQRASYGVVMTTNPQGAVMKIKSSRRLVVRLGLALAVAAIAVPSASAMRMNTTNESGGSVRLYADDLHASIAPVTLKASNVRTDASSPQPVVPGSNVRTDASSIPSEPLSVPAANVRTDSSSIPSEPLSVPAANVRTDAASPQPASTLISDVQTDGASSRPITDARHSALLAHRAQLGLEPPTHLTSTQLPPADDSPGINWSVAGIGAGFGMIGLMLLFGIVFYAGRHNRGRLAAT
jgi:hypothetical protein